MQLSDPPSQGVWLGEMVCREDSHCVSLHDLKIYVDEAGRVTSSSFYGLMHWSSPQMHKLGGWRSKCRIDHHGRERRLLVFVDPTVSSHDGKPDTYSSSQSVSVLIKSVKSCRGNAMSSGHGPIQSWSHVTLWFRYIKAQYSRQRPFHACNLPMPKKLENVRWSMYSVFTCGIRPTKRRHLFCLQNFKYEPMVEQKSAGNVSNVASSYDEVNFS